MFSSKFPFHLTKYLHLTDFQEFHTYAFKRRRRRFFFKNLTINCSVSDLRRILIPNSFLSLRSDKVSNLLEKGGQNCNRGSGSRSCSNISDNNNKKRNNYYDKSKIIPKLIYLHNPWKYFVTKLNLLKLYLFWDREFSQKEFIKGSKQAAVVMTDIIRNQNTTRISHFTTPVGFQQITRDMILSRKDIRLQLIKFNLEHLRRAIPMKVIRRKKFGRKYCFIDMLFVGLRNSKDFENAEDIIKINDIIRRIDTEFKIPYEVTSAQHRIVFAEIFIRFRKDYSDRQDNLESQQNLSPNSSEKNTDSDWSVSFYKILAFDVINYDPK